MNARDLIAGVAVGASLAGGAAVAASPELAEKFGSLYAEPRIGEIHVLCRDGATCELSANVIADPVDADAEALGVAPLRWSEGGVCPVGEVAKLLTACGERENKAAPAVFATERRELVDGVVRKVADKQ